MNYNSNLAYLVLQNPQKLCYDSLFDQKNTDKAILATAFQFIINYIHVQDDPGLMF